MEVELFTILFFGVFFLLLAFGIPFAWVTLALAIGFGFMVRGEAVFPFIIFRTWNLMMAFSLIAIPMFVFMANVLQHSGIVEDLYTALYRWMGPLRGGLAMATVIACTILAAMVGTAGAGVTIMGLMALPAMFKRKYDKKIVLGSIIAGGTLGPLIPPSILFVLYGVNAGVSIGKLFIGGIVPGFILASLFVLYIGIRAYANPKLAPAIPKEERQASFMQQLALTKSLILPVLLIIGVLGSIYLGIATPGEAAGVGAVGAMICAGVRKQLTWPNIKDTLWSTMRTLGVVMWIGFGSYAMVGVFSQAGGSRFIGELITAMPFGKWGALILTQIILIILGMVIDVVGIVFLAAPIFAPIMKSLGFDPLWFGIVFNINLQIGYLSPPFGASIFYLKAVAPPEVTTTDLYKAVLPFMGLQLLGLLMVIIFPVLAIWLPNQMITR